MATPAEIQAQLDATGLAAKIEKVVHSSATIDNQYVNGGIGKAGRSIWTATTAADSAADQATSIAAQLAAFR